MKTKIVHYRWEDSEYNDLLPSYMLKGRRIKPQGGYTYACVMDDSGRVANGMAVCSFKDNYNKKIGRQIAVGRAMKQLNVSRK
jgi:hypothetical protein